MREVLFFPIPNIKHFLKKKLIGKPKSYNIFIITCLIMPQLCAKNQSIKEGIDLIFLK